MITVLPLLAAGGAALAEAIPGVGAFLPGEVALSALATSTHNKAVWLILAATVGACIGDQINYWAGRAFGSRVGTSRLVRRIGVTHWKRGTEMIRRHGAKGVMLSRLLPVVRTLAPLAAGAARMTPLRFSFASFCGCALWATAWVLLGTAFGQLLQTALPFLVVVGIIAAVLTWRLRSRSAQRSAVGA